jgi:phenylacetate-CoA ligase
MTSTLTHDSTDLAGILARARKLLAIDGWSCKRLVELRRERLRDLVAHAVESSPYYREALGAEAASAELADRPTLSKPLLMEEFDRIVTDPRLRLEDVRTFVERGEAGEAFAGAFRAFGTSGATGIPGLFVYTHAEFAEWTAAGLARLARVGVIAETRLVAIGAPSDEHVTRQLFARFQGGRRDVPRLSATTPLAETTSALDAYRPEAIIAYASVLDVLAQEQLEGRLAIAPRITIATSEVLTDETVTRVREAWGSPPVNVYAATGGTEVSAFVLSARTRGRTSSSACDVASSRCWDAGAVPPPVEVESVDRIERERGARRSSSS